VTPAAAHRWRGVLGPALVTLAAFAVLIALGTWQLERKAWKEALIGTLTRRLAAPPMDLPPSGDWAKLAQEDSEYRKVRFRADIPRGEEALVYTPGSAFRPDVTGPGYWILSPARVGGGVLVVNRGFVPEGRQDAATRAQVLPGTSDIVGVLRWPEASGLFTPAGDPARNLWFARDPAEIARGKHWGAVAPFYVEQEAPVPPGGLPQPGALKVQLPNDHLQYAITWYGLAVVLLGVFGFWLRGRLRDERKES
jgi:surfeit locus 1 family protein